jgi:stearoyl-CoA desaturase (delta-9 desaturase)
VFLYVKEANKLDTLERYGLGTPDDWLERNIYSRFQVVGLTLMGVTDVILFGVVPGALIFAAQMVWIPFWAAGVINGIGHIWGYRHWSTPDASTNIVPFGLLIGGEELHNNHHAYPTSAKLSNKWYEFDIGWFYIRILEAFIREGQASRRPRISPRLPAVDLDTLQAIIDTAMTSCAVRQSLKRTYSRNSASCVASPQDARIVDGALAVSRRRYCARRSTKLAEMLPKSRALHTMVDAPRARRRMGLLDGHAGPARQAAPGLVSARRGERH